MEFWKLTWKKLEFWKLILEEIGVLKINWELEFRKLNLEIKVLKIIWKLEFWKLNLRIEISNIKVLKIEFLNFHKWCRNRLGKWDCTVDISGFSPLLGDNTYPNDTSEWDTRFSFLVAPLYWISLKWGPWDSALWPISLYQYS